MLTFFFNELVKFIKAGYLNKLDMFFFLARFTS